MKNVLKYLFTGSILSSFLMMSTSCTKNDSQLDGNSFRLDPNLIPKTFTVILTNGGGDYQQVVLDIQKVEVKEDLDFSHYDDDQFADSDDNADDYLATSDSFGVWKPVQFTPKTINVLTLRNGVEIKLGEAVIYNRVRKVRLTLGTENYIIDQNGDKKVLEFANDADKYMYVKLHSTDIDFISSNEKQILRIDFNADKSIIEDNGRYTLSPSIRPYGLTNFGEIEGIVSPFGIKAKVSIEDGLGNILQTTPEADGSYKIRGLLEGDTYMITYEAFGYQKQVITNVSVKAGKETIMDPITLIQ
jgi:hypothetical protein